MVAASLATGDKAQAGKVTLQALGLATVLGSVLAGVLISCSDGALALMGAGPETGHVHELAAEFLMIRWVLLWDGCPVLRGRMQRGRARRRRHGRRRLQPPAPASRAPAGPWPRLPRC